MFNDKLGVYRVGEQKFYSKLEAIDAMSRTGIHLHWDFNESVYSSYNWTIEPSESLNELYKRRAEQLRNQYDYIVLAYSGGADSHNVLQTFLKNDIKLDEVVSYVNYDATGDKSSWMNDEIFKVATPHIDYVRETYPWVKYTLIDQTQLILDYFSDKNNKYKWIYENNMMFNPNNTIKSNLPLLIKEWRDIINTGKKFCMLVGMDKPRIFHENGKFSFRFLDMIDISSSVSGMAGLKPYTDEMFYWTPDLPEIVIKQSHIIKNYLNHHLVEKLPFVSTDKSDLAYRTINNKKYWLSNHGVHTLIYPDWNINTFTLGKSASTILSNRDTWFFNIEKTNTMHENWTAGIKRLHELLPKYWRNNADDLAKGVKGCWSKDYYLEQ